MDSFTDSKQKDKLRDAIEFPQEYEQEYQIWQMAKKIGKTDNEIRDNYTHTQIIVRTMMDSYKTYIENKLNKVD